MEHATNGMSNSLKYNRLSESSNTTSVTGFAISMCLLGIAFYYYEYYLRVAPSVMSFELKDAFGLNEAQFGLLAAFYYFAYTPMQIPVGMMVDKIGPRKILTFACLICAISTYLFAATTNLILAQFSRFLIGFGSAFAYVGVLKLTNIWLPQKYFALMAGICSALGMFGGISGQIMMNKLVEKLGWQSSLYYAALVGMILSLVLWMALRETSDSQSAHCQTKPEEKLKSLKQILLCKPIWISGLIGCLTFLPVTVLSEVWAVNFLLIVGMTKEQAAMGSSMVFLGFAVGGPLWGWISDSLQSRRVPLIFGSFVSAALMMSVILAPSASVISMYSLLFFTAFFASVQILSFAVSNDLTHQDSRGTAAAFTNMLIMMGGAVLPPLVGKVLDSVGVVDLTIQHYSLALGILPVALVISGILSIMLVESYQKYK